FAELLQYINAHDMPTCLKDFRALPEREQVMFVQFSQQMESLGIHVAESLIDLDLVDKTIGSTVSTTWEKYKPMFLDMRVKLPDPYLGEYFQWLAERIDERLKTNPREPFYKT